MTVETTRPYTAYAGIMGTFVGALAAAGAIAHLHERDARDYTALDLAVLSLATFKAARTITRDEVTSFLREPFTVDKVDEEGHALPLAMGVLVR